VDELQILAGIDIMLLLDAAQGGAVGAIVAVDEGGNAGRRQVQALFHK
jgi:hypothetical protein